MFFEPQERKVCKQPSTLILKIVSTNNATSRLPQEKPKHSTLISTLGHKQMQKQRSIITWNQRCHFKCQHKTIEPNCPAFQRVCSKRLHLFTPFVGTGAERPDGMNRPDPDARPAAAQTSTHTHTSISLNVFLVSERLNRPT